MLQNLKMFIVLMVASGALGFAWAAYQEVDRQKQEIQLLSELVIISQLRLNVLQDVTSNQPREVNEALLHDLKKGGDCSICHIDYEEMVVKFESHIIQTETADGVIHTIERKER